MDAGFSSVVEVGQYFMTKDNEEQFYTQACREYTLPRNDGSSQPNGWIQGNTKIGPVLEATTSCLYGKHGVEIRIWSLRKDNSFLGQNFSWCQCYTCTETPTQQSATTQDQHHAQGLALCHDVTLDIVTHRWVPAGHPQYTGAREGRLWVAQAQTQLMLFVGPQSISLECEHGSGATRFEVQLGPRTQPERRTIPSSRVASQMRE